MTKTRAPRSVWLRPAQRLLTYFETPTVPELLPELPIPAWRKLERLSRQHQQALARGWKLAAARLQQEFRYGLIRFQVAMTALSDWPDSPQPPLMSLSLDDLLADLQALDEEFSAVRWENATHLLSVTTEPLTLEGVELGPFEIQLNCRQWQTGQASPYRIVALEPNPAASNEDVTHPHVQCESLCEGDGRQAIASTLAQGRLQDFFVIVAHLLQTYNEGSPYVSLEDWDDLNCDDCGDLCDSDAMVYCVQCNEAICNDCSDDCVACEESACRNCLEACAACQDLCCSRCLSTCVDCTDNCCSSCLNENERCPDCHETQQEEEDYEPLPADEPLPPDAPPAPPTDAAVQPDGLGQTAVPA